MKLSLEQIAQWTSAQLAMPHGGLPGEATGYSIDTRTLIPGDLFFAIRGERFDAHDFVAQALGKGAVRGCGVEGKGARSAAGGASACAAAGG